MRARDKKNGLTLVEILVVVAIISLLVSIGISAGKNLMDSFENSAGVKAIVSASLANARAMAAKGKYAGVRFQQDKNGDQYMVFIVEADWASPADGFHALQGRNPMKLPSNVGLMAGYWVSRKYDGNGKLTKATPVSLDDTVLSDDSANIKYGKNIYFEDATTFSIVFSPAGKLVTQMVWVRNSQGISDTTGNTDTPSDRVFNKKAIVDLDNAMFYQDDYGGSPTSVYPNEYLGIGPEYSRNSFIIYDKKQLRNTAAESRWSGYLQNVGIVYINPHTGEIVN